MTDTLPVGDGPFVYRAGAAEPLHYSHHRRSGGFTQELTSAVRENPVSAALITMGAVWLFAGGGDKKIEDGGKLFSALRSSHSHDRESARGPSVWREQGYYGGSAEYERAGTGQDSERMTSRAAEGVSRAGGRISGAASGATSRVTGAMSAAYEGMGSAAERAAAFASETGASLYAAGRSTQHAGYDFARSAQQELGELFDRHPLMLGALGLAIGAGIAASLPSTRAENRMVGGASDALKEQAQNLVSSQIDETMKSAERALQEVRREAEAQGLTESAVAEAIRQFGEKLSHVASTARSGVEEELAATGNGAGRSQTGA